MLELGGIASPNIYQILHKKKDQMDFKWYEMV